MLYNTFLPLKKHLKNTTTMTYYYTTLFALIALVFALNAYAHHALDEAHAAYCATVTSTTAQQLCAPSY